MKNDMRTTVRMPSSLYERVKAEATRTGRSTNDVMRINIEHGLDHRAEEPDVATRLDDQDRRLSRLEELAGL